MTKCQDTAMGPNYVHHQPWWNVRTPPWVKCPSPAMMKCQEVKCPSPAMMKCQDSSHHGVTCQTVLVISPVLSLAWWITRVLHIGHVSCWSSHCFRHLYGWNNSYPVNKKLFFVCLFIYHVTTTSSMGLVFFLRARARMCVSVCVCVLIKRCPCKW